jgi:hypothetical protein
MTPVEVLAKSLNVNEPVARVVGGGLIVLAAGAVVAAWRINVEDLYRVAAVVAGFSVLAMVLARLNGPMATVLGWLATGLVVVYAGAFSAQFLTNSHFTPPLMRAGCFMAPWERGCPLALEQVAMAALGEADGADGDDGAVVNNSPGLGGGLIGGISGIVGGVMRPPAMIAPTDPGVATAPPPVVEPAPAPGGADGPDAPPTEGRRVFIQFAGSLNRDAAVSLARALQGAGWRVEGAEQGGERLSSAFGLNEVRYFNAEDAGAAAALAEAVAAALGSEAPRVRDFTRLSARPGHLELWVGPS